MRRGIATFTLDHGKCPRWLFERMVKLGREMTRVLVAEFGPNEFIRRIEDRPDRHSSYNEFDLPLDKTV